MGWLSNFFSNPVSTIWNTLASLPGTPEAIMQAMYDGANGDLSWNPFSQENSVWDVAAGGTKLSQDPRNRQIGRSVGTAIGSYFTGGALGSMMGNSTAGAAASGALWGGAQAAGTGGNIGRGIAGGAMAGGLGSMMPDVTGGYVDSDVLRSGINGAVRGGVGSAVGGGDWKQGAIQGGIRGGISGYGGPPDDLPGTLGGTMADADGETSATLGGYTTPAQADANISGGIGTKQALGASPSWGSPELGTFMQSILPQSPEGWGHLGEGLLGIYSGYRQRKDAKNLMGMVGGRRDAYGKQLQQALQRRDAATGRRSDFGGRAVQLEAKLAELDSRNAPGLMQLQQASTGGMLDMMRSGIRYGGKAGWFGDRYNPAVQQQQAVMPSLSAPPPVTNSMSFDPYDRFRREGGGA